METFVGDVIDIIVQTGITLTGATDLLIKYRKPDGTTGAWVSTIVGGAVTYMHYETIKGDLDQNGVWQLQAYAEFGATVGNGKIVNVRVHNPISIWNILTTAAPTTAPPTTAP
jgi:hypothetical protein